LHPDSSNTINEL
jgi:hypothetical protein